MSRRLVLSLVLALSAFALTAGLTASLNVAAADLGAGGATVASCDPDGVDVSFLLAAGDTSSVSEVTLSGIAATCDTQAVTVQVTGTGVDVTATGTYDHTAHAGALTLDITDVSAADVTRVDVVITG